MFQFRSVINRRVYVVLYLVLIGLLGAQLVAPLTAQAFPSADSTGITSQDCPNWDQVKTHTRGRTISTNGAVIENESISGGGGLHIEAQNVTIRCVKIDAEFSDLYGINCLTNTSCPGLLVENVEISNCVSACGTAQGGSGNPTIWRRVHLHNSQKDLLKIRGDAILEDSYLHDYSPASGAHNDAIQTSTGSNITVRDNRIEGPWSEQTSAYLVKTDFGAVNNLRIENNQLSGGSFTLYLRDGGHGVPTNVVVRDNVWVKNSYQFGTHSVQTDAGTGFEWFNNRFEDGSDLPAPSSTSSTGKRSGSRLLRSQGSSPASQQAGTPSITPNGGRFLDEVTIRIAPPETGGQVYYTLDGSTPTTNSELYTAPVTLSSNSAIKAITVMSGMDSSAVRSAVFHISSPNP